MFLSAIFSKNILCIKKLNQKPLIPFKKLVGFASYLNSDFDISSKNAPVISFALFPTFKPLCHVQEVYSFILFFLWFSSFGDNLIMILPPLNLKFFCIGFKTRESVRFLIVRQNMTANQVIICCFSTS